MAFHTIPFFDRNDSASARRCRRTNLDLLIGFLIAAILMFKVATADAASVTGSPTSVAAGSAVTASWSGVTTSTSWVGLYVPGSADAKYLSWRSTSGASGSAPLAVPAGLLTRSYEMRLFAGGGWTKLATSNAFNVTGAQATTVTANPSSMPVGATVTASWNGVTSPKNWIGLYLPGKADSAFLASVTSNTGATGSVPFTLPSTIAPATYELRLFADGTWTRLAVSGTFGVGGGGDTTAPTVGITAPVSGASVTGSTLTVSASASDNVGVAGVQFKLDGANFGAEVTAAPYTTTGSISTLSGGSHTLTAVARDAAGNTRTSAAIAITKPVLDTQAPSVSVTAPAANAAVSGSTLTVSASASDNVGVVGVQFKLDGASFGAEVTAAPYTVTGSISTLSGGSHTLTAVARDAAGNTTTSAAIAITKPVLDTQAPSVSVTAPAANAAVSGSTLTVSASASDNVGVVGVQFKLDGASFGAEVTAAPYTVTGSISTLSGGSHTLTAVARDAAGNTTTSAAVTINKPVVDTQAPSVPTGLSGTALSSTQVKLTWSASTDNVGVAGYYVYLNDVALGTTTATTYTHSGLTAGTTYNYRVSAFDAVPNHSGWTATPVAVTTPAGADTQAPSVPTGLAGTALSSTQVKLTWNASTDNVGVTGYYVYLNDVALGTTTTPTYTHSGLTAGTTYNYRVSAFDAVPNHSAWTATPVAVTTPGGTGGTGGGGSTKFIPTFTVYYGGGPALTAADAAKLAKFDLIDIDRFRYDNIGGNTWAAIKAVNPAVKIYLYEDGTETHNQQDSTAQVYLNTISRYNVSRGHSMGTLNGNNPALFLLDSGGSRVYNAWFSNTGAGQYFYLMDFGSASYQAYWVESVRSDVANQPWAADGIFADICMTFPAAAGHNTLPAKYPSNSAWSAAMNTFSAAAAKGLAGFGQKLWCNKGDTGSPEGKAVWLALDASATPPDALMEEGAFAVEWGGSAVQFYPETQWKNQVDTLAATNNAKATYVSHTTLAPGGSGTDNWGRPVTFSQALWYSLGSFLLGKNDARGNSYFMFYGAGSYSKIWWHSEYDLIDLGPAVGGYTVTNVGGVNVYRRQFQKGYVYVNPTNTDVASVALGQNLRQLTQANMASPASAPTVSAIPLKAHSAAILLN